ncbi:MAG TPA: PEGA domain-containing protein, partial [Polyangiaceae bacterium]|nr:PEGA domain-containing protein [Polyangiaceae bacterium]
MTAWIPRLALGLTLMLAAQTAVGDDLADEADLHFEHGAAAYQRADYATALEHFLLSNRIVPNRNVMFNIARCYERLGKAAEAYRAYDLARAGESDPTILASIDAELRRIGTKVAVLSISSEPAGATIYIERRDLGPRGVTPRRLALGEGQYRVIVNLPGYQPAILDSGKVSLGQAKELNFVLQPILGQIMISGDSGTKIVADDPKTGPACEAPCVLSLPLGAHTLYASRLGYDPKQVSVEVQEGRVAKVSPQLDPQTGSAVFSTDEPNALVEIDGKPRGFTPVVVTLPAGVHRIRVTLDGFHPLERTVTIKPEQQEHVQLELIQAERVEGASRRIESVENTASSVSIVPQFELTALAYPTLAEALRGSPGFYLWDDRGYIGVGMRGLGRLNSYGNRVLVLVDGVATNDNWIGSSYVGYDALTDLGDVERVELIRGPGSAVYGTGAFSGVINVITRRETTTGVEAGASTNLDGVARGRVRVNLSHNGKSGLYASAAIGRSAGRDFYMPELVRADPTVYSPEAAAGWSRGLDGMRSATLRGRAHHGIWSVQWLWHRYKKQLPNAPFDTEFGNPATNQRDERGFLELRAEPQLSAHTTSVSSVSLHRYRFHGDYAHPATEGGLEVDTYRGHWINLGERVVHHFDSRASLTVGGEAAWHFDVNQRGVNLSGVFLNRSNPYGVLAGYGILDARLGRDVLVSWGARVDHYSTFGTSLNPRL